MAHVVEPIHRILVANRGEIARRIMRTARDMGIGTVAVYADDDADAPFVAEADAAVALNGQTSAQTYLDAAKVLEAAKRTGADAIHPGYGFLSENGDFAQAVIDAGLKWIGPSPQVIRQMGDKLAAKALMQQADVPTLPAIEIEADTDIEQAAQEIGYPVLVKASAGGGGRGMRVVETPNELADAIAGARREAGAAFGNDTVFLEKWLAVSRHVELQILGDHHGNLVHCFERECSIQRRHQKIIEEAPSPAVSDEVRARMGRAAIAAARQLGYASAGTVEFLLSGEDFYFLEVNARLQVEHPVTEEIIGHDLVREQIRVAEGEPLSFTQEQLSINGHAIEARLYAENPAKNFLPSPGTVVRWQPSAVGDARFDSGVEAGSVIGTQFDPMIAKVVVHAPTRREAATRLARVLETTEIQGLTTNRDFLVATLRTPAFLEGDTTTDFIERVAPAPVRSISVSELHHAGIAVALYSQAARRAETKVLRSMPTGWRNSHMPPERIDFLHNFARNKEPLSVSYRASRAQAFSFQIGEATYQVELVHAGNEQVDMRIDGVRSTATVAQHGASWFVQQTSGGLQLEQQTRYPAAGGDDQGGGTIAPMPGAVLSVAVTTGQAIRKGELLLILEAMKMEHRITAPRDGVVEAVHITEGDQVENGQLLVSLAEEA